MGGAAARSSCHWVDRGVKVFRVDNPHTKPLAVLGVADRARSARDDPDVIFLAEAFTRRAVMRELAKIGFTQSYTYFTWKNSPLGARASTSTSSPTAEEREYFRPELLRQHAGHPHRLPRRTAARRRSPPASCSPPRSARATASTRASSTSRTCRCAPGSEEYLDSEKYEVKRARARRPAAADDPAPEPDPPREPGAAAPRQRRASSTTAQRRARSPTPSATGATS